MTVRFSASKVGVYVDTSNMYRNGGQRMRYDVLREFACRDGAEIVRLNAYVSYDADRARIDDTYGRSVNKFYAVLRDFGYKVIVKEVRWYVDDAGARFGKANADLDLAVDMLLQSENLDRIILATGDGDFARVVKAVQNKGCRVEVLALDNSSPELRSEADMFMSGYVIPELIPTAVNGTTLPERWGEVGSTVRGVCYFHKNNYGFMRFLGSISHNIWVTDTKRPDSPYRAAYFRDSEIVSDFDTNLLPSYSYVFEFDLADSVQGEGKLEAVNIKLKGWMPS